MAAAAEALKAVLAEAATSRVRVAVGVADVDAGIRELDTQEDWVRDDGDLEGRRGLVIRLEALGEIDVGQQVQAVGHALRAVAGIPALIEDGETAIEGLEGAGGWQVAQQVTLQGGKFHGGNHEQLGSCASGDCAKGAADVVVVGDGDEVDALALRGCDDGFRRARGIRDVVAGRMAMDVEVGAVAR